MRFWKAHAYGNDFLFVRCANVSETDTVRLAQRMCDRHRGLGADGLILFDRSQEGGVMKLINADGSPAEISGNGLRCLAAILLTEDAPGVMTIQTDAGPKTLELQGRQASRYYFRAAMGQPEQIRQFSIPIAGEAVVVTAMSMGNPQCVVLEGPVDQERLRRLGPALEKHHLFPEGTNVELADASEPGLVRILIWERGVGPTQASGTGACAAAVAAVLFSGAARDLQIASPGGTQRVEWLDQGLFLTGWSEILCEGVWLPNDP